MNGKMIGMLAGTLATALGVYLSVQVVRSLLPDLQRYIRISSM